MSTTRKRAKTTLLLAGTLTALLGGVVFQYRAELIAWYEFRRDFESLPKNAQGLPEYRHRQTGIVFVSVPGGTFLMGSPESEVGREEDEGPQHEVTLSAFLIAKYEVSQAQWSRVMDWNPSYFQGIDLPVEQVSWEECQDFCSLTGLSLPTEAQWEYACRAETQTAFAFGETITPQQVNYDGNVSYGGGAKGEYRGKTLPVDRLEPNDWGLHQMHGNLWEWCEDVYEERFYSKPGATAKNPVCTSGSSYRVFRGGCWIFEPSFCRSASRGWIDLGSRRGNVGFRPSRPSP